MVPPGPSHRSCPGHAYMPRAIREAHTSVVIEELPPAPAPACFMGFRGWFLWAASLGGPVRRASLLWLLVWLAAIATVECGLQ